MNTPRRTRCPYTLRPLDELEALSREHVIPDCLGGSNGYAVKACRSANSVFGETIDAAFAAEPVVAIKRSELEIRSRSGTGRWTVEGKTVDDDRPVQVSLGRDSVDVRFRKPVDVDEEGRPCRIVAGPEQAEAVLQQVKGGLERKGMSFSDVEKKTRAAPPIQGRVGVDFNILRAGLLKIAYLACFEQLGDAFLDDALNDDWQKAIRATKAEHFEGLRLSGAFGPEAECFAKVLIPPLERHEHGIVVANLNQMGPVVLVRLFGEPLLTLFAMASETSNYHLAHTDGDVVVVNAQTRELAREPWKDYLLRIATS